ncbi:MAG: DUF2071 domain-containing protein [Acidobacteriaceae bacterium]|nr:DUF2071 domain-containing protein [Acidobacteriaceae bacterium]
MNEHISPYAPRDVAHPVMLQQWHRLTFLHWPFDPATIRPLIPYGLDLDTFDGAAWVGLTPFMLTGLRLPFLPAFPWISRFPETNVRTYVRGPDGEGGVWFFTLEASRLLAVLGARLFFRLPYRWARMSVLRTRTRVAYRSARWIGEGNNHLVIEPGQPIRAGDRENFLTARYRLYTILQGRIAYAQIFHHRWPLHAAKALHIEQNLFANSGVPQPSGAPHLLYSPRLEVRIDRLRWA